ncbi:hypothetical protein ACFYUV_49915 [Nonomuraea sp. NPDC003560]|uniref:hypothetical protein n=1 Tax=Nonomuraea sp. NPDC003560 TaxID=3364341 RepID=UPI0036A11F44
MSLERAVNLYGACALVADDAVHRAWQTALPGKSESLAAGLVALATFDDLFVERAEQGLIPHPLERRPTAGSGLGDAPRPR